MNKQAVKWVLFVSSVRYPPYKKATFTCTVNVCLGNQLIVNVNLQPGSVDSHSTSVLPNLCGLISTQLSQVIRELTERRIFTFFSRSALTFMELYMESHRLLFLVLSIPYHHLPLLFGLLLLFHTHSAKHSYQQKLLCQKKH